MFIALRLMQRPCGVMVGLTENIQACLGDFLAGTASMARKRHLASTARGFCCFCLIAHSYHRSTLMRTHPAAYCPPGSICGMLSIPRALPPVTHSSALQAPECLWGIIRGKNRNPKDGCLSLFIALRWMQRPERVMVGLAENIQACLRIFWQLQHQWLARDILHLPQGVFDVFVL